METAQIAVTLHSMDLTRNQFEKCPVCRAKKAMPLCASCEFNFNLMEAMRSTLNFLLSHRTSPRFIEWEEEEMKNMNTGPTKVENEQGVSMQMEALRVAFEQMIEVHSVLEKKLQQVLLPDTVKDARANSPDPIRTPLANSLHELVQRAAEVKERFEILTERVVI